MEYNQELERRASEGSGDITEIYEEIWFIIVVFVLAPLILIGGGVTIGIWAKRQAVVSDHAVNRKLTPPSAPWSTAAKLLTQLLADWQQQVPITIQKWTI